MFNCILIRFEWDRLIHLLLWGCTGLWGESSVTFPADSPAALEASTPSTVALWDRNTVNVWHGTTPSTCDILRQRQRVTYYDTVNVWHTTTASTSDILRHNQRLTWYNTVNVWHTTTQATSDMVWHRQRLIWYDTVNFWQVTGRHHSEMDIYYTSIRHYSKCRNVASCHSMWLASWVATSQGLRQFDFIMNSVRWSYTVIYLNITTRTCIPLQHE